MKEVKIFSESSHSALETVLNDYLNSLHHSNVVKCITYNFPNKAGEVWSAVVEIDNFGGKPVFWAANTEELEYAVKMYGDGVKPPFVVRIPDHTTTVERSAFENNENIGVVLLPDSLTRIDSFAFKGCRNLFNMVIPSSVTHIGCCAFDDCYSLIKLVIPRSVTEIKGRIANVVNTIKVDPNNPVYNSRNDCNAIIETATNTLINGCYNTKIPDSVTKIADSAFEGCRLNINFKIPKTVCEIGEYAFASCQGSSLSIPDSVSRIEECVFSNSDISTIYIPNSVNYIDSSAFQGCSRLQDIHIKILDPNKVQFGDNNDCFDYFKEKGRQYRLWVPKGTKSVYDNHPAFGMFDVIVEEEK